MTQEPRNSVNLSLGDGSHLAEQEPPITGVVGGSPVFRRTGRPANTTPRKRCEQCGDPYVPYRNHDAQRYCSRECARKAMARTGWWTDHGLRGQDRVIQESMTAKRAIPRPVTVKRHGEYVGYDADALLEEISDAEQARPGLWYG